VMADASGSRRRRRRRRTSRLIPSRVGEWAREHGHSTLRVALAITVLGSMLAIGAVHVVSLLVLAPVALACAVLAAVLTPGARVPLAALVSLGLGVFSLLQAVPLPAKLLSRIAPSAADIWERSLRPFGEAGPGWVSLSLDPGASTVEAVKWCCYAAVFLGAFAVSRLRGENWGLTLAFGSSVLAGLVTLAHGAAGEREVFAFYVPSFEVSRWNVGPLLNQNNLAGYLNIGVFTGVALMSVVEPPLPRPFVVVGVALCAGMSVLSGSRGGVAALALGVVVLLVVEGAKTLAQSSRRGSLSLGGGAAVLLGGGLLVVLGIRAETWKYLLDRDVSKIELAAATRGIITDHPIFGVGRGAFESVFPAYRPNPGHMVYPYAENFLAQWIAEWGAPVALLALLTLSWTLRPKALRLSESAAARAATLGIIVLLLQNLVDLGLELPSVMFLVALTLGTLWGAARRERAPNSASGGTPWAWAIAPVGLVALVAAAIYGRFPLKEERTRLQAAYERLSVESRDARAAFHAEVRAAMRRHPAEPYFPLLGALVAWRSGTENPLPWLQRVLEREVFPSRAHLVLAHVLRSRRATSQALLELRLAVESDPQLYSRAATLAASWAPNYNEALRAVPAGTAGAETIAVLCQKIASDHDRCTADLLARDPDNGVGHELAARGLLRAIVDDKAECAAAQRGDCERRFNVHVDKLRRRAPSSAVVLRAELLIALDRAAEAESLLAEACESFAERVTCLRARVSAAIAAGGAERVTKAVRALVVSACPPADQCARTHEWIADQFASRQRWVEAQHHTDLATREDPTAARWLNAARAARNAGSVADAVAALDQAERLAAPADNAIREGIRGERARVAGLLSGKVQ
jgi:hypothetical protein